MSNSINYIGEKVVVLEAVDHKYVHVMEVDGDNLVIDDNGFLGIKEGHTYILDGGEFKRVPILFHPSGWNFVYDNKNPGVEPGVYIGHDPRLPQIYPNCNRKIYE